MLHPISSFGLAHELHPPISDNLVEALDEAQVVLERQPGAWTLEQREYAAWPVALSGRGWSLDAHPS